VVFQLPCSIITWGDIMTTECIRWKICEMSLTKKYWRRQRHIFNSSRCGATSPNQEEVIDLDSQVKELKDLKLATQLINKLKQSQSSQNH
jgi:hypothetical protein